MIGRLFALVSGAFRNPAVRRAVVSTALGFVGDLLRRRRQPDPTPAVVEITPLPSPPPPLDRPPVLRREATLEDIEAFRREVFGTFTGPGPRP